MALTGRPKVEALRPSRTWSAMKAATVPGSAGSAARPCWSHHAENVFQSRAYDFRVDSARLLLARSAAVSMMSRKLLGNCGCSITAGRLMVRGICAPEGGGKLENRSNCPGSIFLYRILGLESLTHGKQTGVPRSGRHCEFQRGAKPTSANWFSTSLSADHITSASSRPSL
jgi:hypothetical protein